MSISDSNQALTYCKPGRSLRNRTVVVSWLGSSLNENIEILCRIGTPCSHFMHIAIPRIINACQTNFTSIGCQMHTQSGTPGGLYCSAAILAACTVHSSTIGPHADIPIEKGGRGHAYSTLQSSHSPRELTAQSSPSLLGHW